MDSSKTRPFVFSHTENNAPYSLVGETGDASYMNWGPDLGSRWVRAEIFRGQQRQGGLIATIEKHFTVVDGIRVDPAGPTTPVSSTTMRPLPTESGSVAGSEAPASDASYVYPRDGCHGNLVHLDSLEECSHAAAILGMADVTADVKSNKKDRKRPFGCMLDTKNEPFLRWNSGGSTTVSDSERQSICRTMSAPAFRDNVATVDVAERADGVGTAAAMAGVVVIVGFAGIVVAVGLRRASRRDQDTAEDMLFNFDVEHDMDWDHDPNRAFRETLASDVTPAAARAGTWL